MSSGGYSLKLKPRLKKRLVSGQKGRQSGQAAKQTTLTFLEFEMTGLMAQETRDRWTAYKQHLAAGRVREAFAIVLGTNKGWDKVTHRLPKYWALIDRCGKIAEFQAIAQLMIQVEG